MFNGKRKEDKASVRAGLYGSKTQPGRTWQKGQMKLFLAKLLRCVPALAILGLLALSLNQSAFATDDDVTTIVTSVSGYWTAIKVVAAGVLLFVLGRKIIRKV